MRIVTAINGTTSHMTVDGEIVEDVVDAAIRAKQKELINALPLDKYELPADGANTNGNGEVETPFLKFFSALRIHVGAQYCPCAMKFL